MCWSEHARLFHKGITTILGQTAHLSAAYVKDYGILEYPADESLGNYCINFSGFPNVLIAIGIYLFFPPGGYNLISVQNCWHNY